MSQRHSQTIQDLIQTENVNPEKGLTYQQAAQRLNQHGKNMLIEEKEIRFLSILREEITQPMILLLIAVGVLYSFLGNLTDALTIITIIAILVLAEVWQEYRAERSVNALKQLAPPTTVVLRNGLSVEVPTAFLVPGDILLLRMGQRVPADARLLEAFGLELDESSLTGESFPVAKDASAVLPLETRVTEQSNMLFSGTVIVKGRAKALVTSTGTNTELGKISGITKTAKEPKTALQLSMKQLSRTLVWIALFFSILIPVLSYIRGLQPGPGEAVLYGLALAFVVIPEELPIIITLVLGVGSYALSRKGAIVKRLPAAETLGHVTVIVTDKTGTITESKMQVEHLYFDGKLRSLGEFKENEKAALRTAFLASEAIHGSSNVELLVNPMTKAILEQLQKYGYTAKTLMEGWVLKNELSFDVKSKLASYIYQYGNSTVALTNGAPEILLEKSFKILLEGQETELTDELRDTVSEMIVHMAQAGERVLAFGYRRLPFEVKVDKENLEREIVFVGVLGFMDPPRREVKGAIKACQEAGIRVIMVTGDHPKTAKSIANQVNINSANVLTGNEIAKMTDFELKQALEYNLVIARATPEDKLRIVRLLRANGEVVAVTGDGINDAPALKEAHIGIAMGIRGSDVAKEASDMILTDDNFATIETAVNEGRRLFSNLRKGVRYYLACKIALVSIFLVPIILGIPLPFAPIQIILLELFMDLAASATFVAEPQEAGTMKKPPFNPSEKFMNRRMLKTLFLGALSLFLAVTATYLLTYYLTVDVIYAQTVAFATWMLGHIFLAFNFRSENQPLLKQGIFSNKIMLLWALLAVIALVTATSLPFMQQALQITALTASSWVLVVGVSFVAAFWMELKKLLHGKI